MSLHVLKLESLISPLSGLTTACRRRTHASPGLSWTWSHYNKVINSIHPYSSKISSNSSCDSLQSCSQMYSSRLCLVYSDFITLVLLEGATHHHLSPPILLSHAPSVQLADYHASVFDGVDFDESHVVFHSLLLTFSLAESRGYSGGRSVTTAPAGTSTTHALTDRYSTWKLAGWTRTVFWAARNSTSLYLCSCCFPSRH